MPPLPVPPVWAIVLSILFLLFGGTYGIVWMIRKEIRDSRLQPGLEEAQRLEAQRTAEEIAGMLRESQKEAMAEMRQLLAASREESSAAQVEAHKARTESRLLRTKVEELERSRELDRDTHAKAWARVERLISELTAAGVEIPAWWAAGA